MWAASIVMAAFYIYIFYTTRLYASMGIYIYFFAASIYGWVRWITKNRDKDTGNEIISRVDRKFVVPILVGIVLVGIILCLVLIQFSHNPYYITIGDALTTSLNIIALWMISRKWAEQWLLIIPANLISGILLFLQHDILSGCLFIIFFVVSIFGYRNWRRMINEA